MRSIKGQLCTIQCRKAMRGIYVVNEIEDSKHCITAIFASEPEPALSQPGDGRWLAVLLPRRNAIPRKLFSRTPSSPGLSPVHLRPTFSHCPIFFSPLFIMFKLARGRPIAAAFRAATVRYSRCRAIHGPITVDIVLIHHLGVIRLIQTGPAAEAEPVHSRVPVCPPPQIGMSTASRSLGASHSYFGPGQVADIGNSMALVSPRATSLAPLRRPSLSPGQLVYFARLLENPPTLRSN